MKKAMFMVLSVVIAGGLAGCPVFGGAGKIEGHWEWVEPARLVDPTTVSDYENAAVAQDFADNGRLRKTLIFDKDQNFTYIEEAFLPDRQPVWLGDKGSGVNWSWIVTYHATGAYDTARYGGESRELAIPGLDTELNVVISEYTETMRIDKRDTDGNRVRDNLLRIEYTYIETSSTSGAENPLVLRGLIGVNPFDELMVSWAQHVVGKDLDYNRSHQNNVETYLRVVPEDE